MTQPCSEGGESLAGSISRYTQTTQTEHRGVEISGDWESEDGKRYNPIKF